MTAIGFVAAAAIGAAARELLGRLGAAWAVLLAVNALGSAGAGLLIANDVDGPWATVIGIGLLGAFTTFSAFALEVRRLGPTRGAAYAVATVVICCTVVALAAAT